MLVMISRERLDAFRSLEALPNPIGRYGSRLTADAGSDKWEMWLRFVSRHTDFILRSHAAFEPGRIRTYAKASRELRPVN